MAEEKESTIEEKKETKIESTPAVKKETKKNEEAEEKVELEREYVIPLRRGVIKVARTRRAKKAIRLIKEFLAKHMRVEDRDTRKVKIDQYLNEEIWYRGIRKPANKIKVKAVKKGGIVYAELFELPPNMKFHKAREERKALEAESHKTKQHKHEEKKEETAQEKLEEKEKEQSSAEAGLAKQKQEARKAKHTTHSEHEKKTHPTRLSLKK